MQGTKAEVQQRYDQVRLRMRREDGIITQLADIDIQGFKAPERIEINGIDGLKFWGGDHGNSYAKVRFDPEFTINDQNGFSFCAWVYFEKSQSIWERLFDFGNGQSGPYTFLTRRTRGVCFAGEDIAIDYFASLPEREWVHIAMTVEATKDGTSTYAGPKLYVNGVCVANGAVSQTSSGRYKAMKAFFDAMTASKDMKYYLGHSQFSADPDFSGVLSKIVFAQYVMAEHEIVEELCAGMSDEALINMAFSKYLVGPKAIIDGDIVLPESLIGGEVKVIWKSSDEKTLTSDGKIGNVSAPQSVLLTANLIRNNEERTKTYACTVISEEDLTHVVSLNHDENGIDISDKLYGLFYEDINNAADGGIYAEMIQNRSFEAFRYDIYDARSGIHGKSTGRIATPLAYWFGDIDKVQVKNEASLGEFLGATDPRANRTYISMPKGTLIENRGFCDQPHLNAITVKEGETYYLSLWMKGSGTLLAYLSDALGEKVSDSLTVECGASDWVKIGDQRTLKFVAKKTEKVSLCLYALTDCNIDMISLMPEKVWGAEAEDGPSAKRNVACNTNYRLRRDLVQSLKKMNPKFLRFPGGCISEGSYIWENVYDWKESVGPVETRVENFNVWGYMMTMGLGYYEYFQLAEDLGATPLPVMACGVLCQARSDYAHPAGGTLREKYIQNFLDLIDFALSEDFEQNNFAKMRRDLGHPEIFDLQYLGVGNENWGHEFFANFECFKKAIDEHVLVNYPERTLTIISTVGAQGDDDAYQKGWRFLSGFETESPVVAFSDGEKEIIEQVTYYEQDSDYMMTIADEHYYRSNEYLLNNADRYHYYAPGSQVFVGEYASTDKNTMAGALAEAAIMTHFEERSDVVKLAATAPLFNKVRGDGLYRWTPDCIWFDDDEVWHTPNYYVQSLFAQNIGTQIVPTKISGLSNGQMKTLEPFGGFEIPVIEGSILLRHIEVVDCVTGERLFEEHFDGSMDTKIEVFGDGVELNYTKMGLVVKNKSTSPAGLRYEADWNNYTCKVLVTKIDGEDGLALGVGYKQDYDGAVSSLRFVLDCYDKTTGLKVIKRNIEGYKLGDFASSEVAGNLRGVYKKSVNLGQAYELEMIHNSAAKTLTCKVDEDRFELTYRLNPYSHDLFVTASEDERYQYIKLVNPYEMPLKIAIETDKERFESKAICISLTGTSENISIENVNKKQKEVIHPIQTQLDLSELDRWNLPAYSLQIIKMKAK